MQKELNGPTELGGNPESGYYILIDGKEHGPYSLNKLRIDWASGRIGRNTLYALPGMPEWRSLAALLQDSRRVQPTKEIRAGHPSAASAGTATGPTRAEESPGGKPKRCLRHSLLIAGGGVLLLLGSGIAFWVTSHPTKPMPLALEELRTAAENGDAQAQFKLAEMYMRGKGLPVDVTNALAWYRRAALQGEVQAQMALAKMNKLIAGESFDENEALDWLRKAANQGSAEAQYELGSRYYWGFMLTNDYSLAAEWYLKAAQQNQAEAQLALGHMLSEGLGIAKNEADARKWLKRAAGAYLKRAKRGDIDSQFELGKIFLMGDGVPTNITEAVRWFRTAAEKGTNATAFRAAMALADLNLKGQSMAKNEKEGVQWLQKAAELGGPWDQEAIAERFATGRDAPKDLNEAAKWFRKSIGKQTHATARWNLGERFAKGDGVPKDEQEALKWFRLAAESGDYLYQDLLAYNLKEGKGVPRDEQEAEKWLTGAAKNCRQMAEHGDADAQITLGEKLARGEGIAKDPAGAIRWFEQAISNTEPSRFERNWPYETEKPQPDARLQHEASARTALVWLCSNGFDSPELRMELLKLERRAAERRHADAQPSVEINQSTTANIPRPESFDFGLHRVQAAKVVNFSAKITDRNGTYVAWSWKLTIKNSTSNFSHVSGKIQFLDREGFELDSHLFSRDIEAGKTETFTDSSLVKSGVAARVDKVRFVPD